MKSLRRILIVHPYGIGDVLFITPVLRALRLLPEVEKVDLLLGSRTGSLMRTNPHVDEIYTMDRDLYRSYTPAKTFQELRKLGRLLRGNRYDLMLDFSLRREYSFFGMTYLGIPRRAGFDYKKRGIFFTHRFPLPDGFERKHVVDFICDCAELSGVPVKGRFLEIYEEPEAQMRAAEIISQAGLEPDARYFVAAPGGGESWGADARLKQWPVERFADLLSRIPKPLMPQHVFIAGSPAEQALAEKLRAQLAIPSTVLAGRTDLMTAVSVIARAALFVGNDGGLVHIAHALRRPLIAIYGPVDPEIYGPYPCSENAVTVFQGPADYRKFRYDPNGRHILSISADTAWKVVESSGILSRYKKECAAI